MARIFISYRRAKSSISASSVKRFCAKRFGRGSVFLDTESIRPGEVFPKRIADALLACEVFLPIICPDWHTIADDHGFRLQQEDDWVRREIEIVLQRKKKLEPVLIIPLIEADAKQIEPNLLPESLKALADNNSIRFSNESDLSLIAPAIDEFLGSPPMGDFGYRAIFQKPDYSRRNEHRFRFVRSAGDLEPFVTLSDAEAAIAEANPELSGEKRKALYDRWCQWTARNEFLRWDDPGNESRSFMVLDQLQSDGRWLPISVSILLPLTLEGARHLLSRRNWTYASAETRNAVTLRSQDLARGISSRLLIDTWIVRQRTRREDRIVRFDHYHWAHAMLLRHIAEFWNPEEATEFKFFCEPDNPTIGTILNDLWFNEENRNEASGNLFVLKYPLDEDRYGPGDEEGIKLIKSHIREIGTIPIVNS